MHIHTSNMIQVMLFSIPRICPSYLSKVSERESTVKVLFKQISSTDILNSPIMQYSCSITTTSCSQWKKVLIQCNIYLSLHQTYKLL